MANLNLVSNGKTDYVILVPETTNTFVDFAVKTLNETIFTSAGVSFEVVKNANGKKFISIGKTYALKALNPQINYGKDGFTAVEVDGNLYLFGESDYGPIWAVYALLEDKVGYRFYTPEDIKIEKRQEIDVTGFNVTHTPTLPERCSGFGLAKYDLEYATGLKAYAWYGQRLDGEYFWGAWAHNHVGKFINPKKYYKDHPEWFYQMEKFKQEDPELMRPAKMQLCLSNMEMRDEFFKNVIEEIKNNERATHFLLGLEDNDDFCRCPKCMEYINRIGESGLHMDFINDMARRVEAWRKQNAPEREISIGGFAYSMETTFKAPVKRVNGEYVPIDPCVVAEPNVFIMFAPIYAPETARAVTDKRNKDIMLLIDRWKSICKRFTLWTYYGSFRRRNEFIDGIYRFKEEIRYFKELGCEFFYVECPSIPGAISFQAMTLWVLTQLEWDNTLDTDELVKEFCDFYYKEGSPHVLEYFYLMMNHMKKVRERTEYLTGKEYCYGTYINDTVRQLTWDMNVVYDASLMLDKAEQAIKDAGHDEKTERKLLDRIEVERMTLIHIQLEYFNKETSEWDEKRTVNAYPKEKILELCDEFERIAKKYGYTRVSGDYTVEEALEVWRGRANNASRVWQDRIDLYRGKLRAWSEE